MSQDFFFSAGETAERLGTNTDRLKQLSVAMSYLYIGARNTRLWPSKYIVALAKYLDENMLPPILDVMKDFSRLPTTQRLVQSIQAQFKAKLEAQKRFTFGEVASLFCVGTMTVTNWHKAGVFTPIASEVQPKRNRGKPKQVVYYVPQQELRRIYEWKLPEM